MRRRRNCFTFSWMKPRPCSTLMSRIWRCVCGVYLAISPSVEITALWFLCLSYMRTNCTRATHEYCCTHIRVCGSNYVHQILIHLFFELGFCWCATACLNQWQIRRNDAGKRNQRHSININAMCIRLSLMGIIGFAVPRTALTHTHTNADFLGFEAISLSPSWAILCIHHAIRCLVKEQKHHTKIVRVHSSISISIFNFSPRISVESTNGARSQDTTALCTCRCIDAAHEMSNALHLASELWNE